MPAPTEKTIRNLVGERSFARGERYYLNGHVHAARRQGNLLKARCYGADDNDYRLEVRLSGSRIIAGRCSCPIGEGGLCKHVAALLLNWRDRPDEFRDSPDIETMLADRSQPELVDMIRVLLDAEPELEDIVESMLTSGARSVPELQQHVQQSVAEGLRRLVDGGGAPGLAAATIRGQRTQSQRRMSAGETVAAVAIARGIVAAVLEGYDVDADASGEVARAVGTVVGDLTRYFADLSADEGLRGEVFHDLLSVLWFDVCHTGAGLAEAVPEAISRHATVDEKRSILVRTREFLPSRRGSVSDAWQRECWGALIADMAGDALSESEYAEVCREFGLTAGRPEVRVEPGKGHAATPGRERKRGRSSQRRPDSAR